MRSRTRKSPADLAIAVKKFALLLSKLPPAKASQLLRKLDEQITKVGERSRRRVSTRHFEKRGEVQPKPGRRKPRQSG